VIGKKSSTRGGCVGGLVEWLRSVSRLRSTDQVVVEIVHVSHTVALTATESDNLAGKQDRISGPTPNEAVVLDSSN
jgi:hypothetical protein